MTFICVYRKKSSGGIYMYMYIHTETEDGSVRVQTLLTEDTCHKIVFMK